MKIIKNFIAVTVAVLSLGIPLCVSAFSTADAITAIDTKRPCSLTVTFKNEKVNTENIETKIYKFASVSADFEYTLTDKFSNSKINIKEIKSADEWSAVSQTVSAYIIADSIEPDGTANSDGFGKVIFTELSAGLYFVAAENGFEPFAVAVPGLENDGNWLYDVSVFPKPVTDPEKPFSEYKVIKQWKDSSVNRPEKVEIEIYKDGSLYEKVFLSAENSWMYEWSSDTDSKWTAVERNIKSGYFVTVESRENTFVVTNTDTGASPDTGEFSDNSRYILPLFVFGMALLSFGMAKRLKRNVKA